MASRPVFVPRMAPYSPGVDIVPVEFKWHPGIAKVQKQKSVESLHESASDKGLSNLLEISSKSRLQLGNQLSAFELSITTKKKHKTFTVECAFQSSKVFALGGPYSDLLNKSSKDAKTDLRLKESGELIGFEFFGQEFPLKPRTYFYDWLYISALHQNRSLAEKVLPFRGFTDIEFNPIKSVNCQAYSVALYVSLSWANKLDVAIQSPEHYLESVKDEYQRKDQEISVQGTLL